MFLAKNFHFDKSVSIAFDWSNTLCAKPKPILQAERDNKSVVRRNVISFLFCLMKSWIHHDEIFALLR